MLTPSMRCLWPVAALALLSLTGCSRTPEVAADPSAQITEAGYRESVRVLASDEFEGRRPGQAGGDRTLDWLEAQVKALGLKPGVGDSYRQRVPLVEITAAPDAVLQVGSARGQARFAYGDDMVVWTKRVVPASAVQDSPLVFVGYGIVAPEVGWNDYAGLDMRGKTAVILINDPDFDGAEPAPFRGKAMTYYGRWTYKFEEAARQRAAGALIIHDTEPAAYGWDVVRNSNTGPQLDAESVDGNAGRAAIEGWVQLPVAQRMFALAGQDLDALRAAARQPGFKPVALDAKASVTVRNQVRKLESYNLVAVLPGASKPDEHVVYMAHWDHLGRDEQAAAGTDGNYNGAVDNASGVAGILEVLKAFAAGPRPARSVALVAVTAEESGLLGSLYLARNPPFALAKTAAVINLDALHPYGRTRDIEVLGFGASQLDDLLAEAAVKQQRVLKPDAQPEKGYFFRSDHFMLAKEGVPALFIKSGEDGIDKTPAEIIAQRDDYLANRYHKPADEYDPSWNVAGSIEDLKLLWEVGQRVADGTQWPAWREGNEFRAARERTAAERPAPAP
jgi:Zn-dependent M28 family amino/carboxypeptidase